MYNPLRPTFFFSTLATAVYPYLRLQISDVYKIKKIKYRHQVRERNEKKNTNKQIYSGIF